MEVCHCSLVIRLKTQKLETDLSYVLTEIWLKTYQYGLADMQQVLKDSQVIIGTNPRKC